MAFQKEVKQLIKVANKAENDLNYRLSDQIVNLCQRLIKAQAEDPVLAEEVQRILKENPAMTSEEAVQEAEVSNRKKGLLDAGLEENEADQVAKEVEPKEL
jgi:hypothetical protein